MLKADIVYELGLVLILAQGLSNHGNATQNSQSSIR